MSAPSFTPGPWHYRQAKQHFHIEAQTPGFGTAVAEVGYVANANTGWTSEANARLIAAAPDLYAALEALRSAVEQFRPDADWCEPELAPARAALKEARGEA